jgi:hypothetical protein
MRATLPLQRTMEKARIYQSAAKISDSAAEMNHAPVFAVQMAAKTGAEIKGFFINNQLKL